MEAKVTWWHTIGHSQQAHPATGIASTKAPVAGPPNIILHELQIYKGFFKTLTYLACNRSQAVYCIVAVHSLCREALCKLLPLYKSYTTKIKYKKR